jgi:hypothetical protein
MMTQQYEIGAPKLSLKLLKEIDMILEEFYPEAQKTGTDLADKKFSKSQIRGLENIIVSTTRFSEIINYIKNQAGKERKDNQWGNMAHQLLSTLDTIERKAEEITSGPADRLEVKLRLARGWARQVVAHYLYADSLREGQP